MFQLLQFALHLAAIFVLASYCSVWFSGLFQRWVIPIIDPGNRTSSFQFLFSHIFAFTFIPAVVAGFINSHYRAGPALFVWTFPTGILIYKFVTFPAGVLQNHFDAAFQHYFAGDFLIGEFHNFSGLFALASNPDFQRGMDQLHVVGPFYAGLGYSLAALLVLRLKIPALSKAFGRRG